MSKKIEHGELHLIAKKLSRHSILVKQWSTFHNSLLGCSETLSTIPLNEVYDKVLETLNTWHSSAEGCIRNIPFLVKVLKEEGFVSAAGNVN
jgi:hypothetical protein